MREDPHRPFDMIFLETDFPRLTFAFDMHLFAHPLLLRIYSFSYLFSGARFAEFRLYRNWGDSPALRFMKTYPILGQCPPDSFSVTPNISLF